MKTGLFSNGVFGLLLLFGMGELRVGRGLGVGVVVVVPLVPEPAEADPPLPVCCALAKDAENIAAKTAAEIT
jgi:hypothetical protein